MKLHYQTYFNQVTPSEQKTPVVIIPGLFGSTGNWRGFAKKLSESWPVLVIDQRNHGRSPHHVDNSYLDLAEDVLELIDDLGFERVSLCAHSMGGKTAMTFALLYPDRVDALIVLDIAPVTYSHSHATILEGLQDVDLSKVGSRSEVEKQLVDAIPDKSTRMFIMLSLAQKDGAFFWRLNVDALYSNLPLIGSFPAQELVAYSYDRNCLFLKGAKSDYLIEDYYPSIKQWFSNADIAHIDDAGHWLHIEQQDAVLEHVSLFLKKGEKNDRS